METVTGEGGTPLATEATQAAILDALGGSVAGFTPVTMSALAASKVLLAASGVLRAACGVLSASAATGTYYVQLLSAGSLPSDGAVTHLCTPIRIDHVSGIDDMFRWNEIPVGGITAASGAVVALSTTLSTLTVSGAYLLVGGSV